MWQRWLNIAFIALVISAGLLIAYRHWQASPPTGAEIARTETVLAYLASNPMLEGYRQVITDVRVEFQNDTNGYYLFFDTALTSDDLAFAEGIYTHFNQFKFDRPELELGRSLSLTTTETTCSAGRVDVRFQYPSAENQPSVASRKRGAVMAVEMVHYKLTADEYQRMIEVGIITEGAPVELIEGELIQMAAFGSEHMRCVGMLNRRLVVEAGDAFFVSPQGSIRLDNRSEPEPDFALLRSAPRGRTPPAMSQVVLVVEVSDTSLMYDLNVKAPLYARAGIPEYWVSDLTAQRVLRHIEPRDGRYTVVEEFAIGDQITSLTDPPITIAVADIFA